MDASELFSISSRQPARMPPDIKELPPITRGRSSNFPDRVGSPSASPHQSRRKSAGCSMRTVKEERQQADAGFGDEGMSCRTSMDSDREAADFSKEDSRQTRPASSARHRTGRNQDFPVPHSGSSSRRSSCNAWVLTSSIWIDEYGAFVAWMCYTHSFLLYPSQVMRSVAHTFRVYSSGSSGPLLFLLHGAGHTSLSWACFTRLLREGSLPLRVFAYDARGHGATMCADNKTLSAEVLTEDGIAIVQYLFNRLVKEELSPSGTRQEASQESKRVEGATEEASKSQRDPDSLPSVILVGHSMGGAIATRMAASGRVPQLHGLMVLDVVEGTALAALPQMAAFVSRFPSLFTSCKEAVNWSIFAGLLCNKSSAAISIPSQLVKTTRGALPATHKGAEKGPPDEEVWTWRVDVMATEPYWEGWFRGMSQAFLASRCVKILICSSSDRLDKELMIAHMQGKFQVQIVSGSGHVIEVNEIATVAATELTRLRSSPVIGFIYRRASVQDWFGVDGIMIA
ncbi:protein phosphatase methylesterase 1, putative [Eimeria brunetti]|uniref:protein phosphatase methylesterase-1 n=1 Tax=Eimeria brunetti TaxID=51314 RepID=U6LRX2_9EIME|nr:protein phosphatase methylesterase 1, putative [Eimeria brunetti]